MIFIFLIRSFQEQKLTVGDKNLRKDSNNDDLARLQTTTNSDSTQADVELCF